MGKNSAEGRIVELSSQEESETPLQRKLNKIAMDISKLGLLCALVAVFTLFLRFGIELGIGTIEWDTGESIMTLI